VSYFEFHGKWMPVIARPSQTTAHQIPNFSKIRLSAAVLFWGST